MHGISLLTDTLRYSPKHQCFSLFDYAVRELRFSDAAAQRRIQTMRLCRRHGWVRAMLHSGDLSLTATAQMETAFAAAERECRRAIPNVGLEHCHDLLGQPAWPSAACDRDADEAGADAGAEVASAAAMTASAAHGLVAAGQEARSPRDAGGHEDRHAGDHCSPSSDRPAARSPRDAGGYEDRHTGSDHCSPSSDQPDAVDARPAAAGVQPAGRSHAATSDAAPASTPGRVPDRPDSNTATRHAPPQAAPGHAPRTGLAGEVAAHTPVVRASHAAAQHRGAGHADALPARLESSGAASPSPAPSRAPVPAAPSSDQGPAAPLLPPTSRTARVVAPSEPPPTAALAPKPSRGDPPTELSAVPVSAAALLHPQRQRELIEQAAGMTTRQVAGLLATAAPEVVPPRDTLRAVAPDRFTLKVSIDQECEQGLRQLKNLISHLDPRMSWGDLVARLVREAVARHDPRGGGRRPGRAGSTAASSRRERSRTPSVVPAAEPAGGGSGDTPAPQAETAAVREQRGAAMSPNAAPVRGSAPTAPAAGAKAAGATAPGTRAGTTASATPAAAAAPVVESHPTKSAPEPDSATSAAAATPEGQSAGARVPCPAPRVPDRRPQGVEQTEPVEQPEQRNQASGDPLLRGPAPPAGGARQTGPSGAPEGTAAPQSTSGGVADRSHAAPVPQDAPPAPEFASGRAADGSDAAPIPQHNPPAPEFAGGGKADGTDVPPGSPGVPPAPELAGSVPPMHGAGGTPGGASPRFTGDAPRGPRRSPVRRPIPAAVRRHVWLRDGGRCCYRDPLTGRRCNSAHLLQIDHLLPVAEGGGPEPENLALSCFAHHRMRHGYGPAPPAEPSR